MDRLVKKNLESISAPLQGHHHQLSNFVVRGKENAAEVFFYGTATHYSPQPDGRNIWTVVRSYETKLERNAGVRKVTTLKLNLSYIDGNAELPALVMHPAPIKNNKEVVDSFFAALETQEFDRPKEIFSPLGRQLNPYIPEGFPQRFDGAEGIYRQYSSLPQNFGR